MTVTNVDRRRFLAATAAASAATMVAPFVRSTHAAGTSNVGFWDHWVAGPPMKLVADLNNLHLIDDASGQVL